LYTAALPPGYRSDYGAYYTPPALSQRLIEMSAESGANWGTCRVLDASCGGAAFLAPVALKMLETCPRHDAAAVRAVAARLNGYEVDPFAAWMSQVLVEAALLPICAATGQHLPQLVEVCNSLERELTEEERFDVIIGNPPYGRVVLDPYQRVRFASSLYGHANLYGVFTHASLRWVKPGGIIAYVTPTSMLGGQYFKALRALLANEAPPVAIDFVTEREGVFEDVLQETMLAVYKRNGRRRAADVYFLKLNEKGVAVSRKAGVFSLPRMGGAAWIIPRTPADATLVHNLESFHTRLADYGYGVSTGPLVWNRHKNQFHSASKTGMFPVIWAEAVTSSGSFEWRSEKRSHQPWFKPREKDHWLLTKSPCVLLQRTTAKEQKRRLIAAELPAKFVHQHKAVIVENHLNMIRALVARPPVSTAVISALLKSDILDRVFRCINGSVAVSAYEIESLPLPTVSDAQRLDRMIQAGATPEETNQQIENIYLGLTNASATVA
jgi:adenine-specific DNA-methyltransferase